MSGIAVIGMSGRLPGARDLNEYWANLLAGRDGITRLPAARLRGLVPDSLLDDPRWIGASGRISGAFGFDPAFFGISPKEALINDPQHRLLLSAAARALEDACVVAEREGRIGVFAGVGRNSHEDIVRRVLEARGEPVDEMAVEIGNVKDHAGTKVAYRLGLRGPAMTVQSACSTGLLAVHQAGLSLAGYECDIAVAAAATLRLPEQFGYLYIPDGIGSHDGYCRAFSSAASGGIPGDGAVAVVLKRWEDAVRDGDRVYAVVRGSAVNNDGAKSGYAMVSAEAQERVIRDALLFAETDAGAVGAVEAHGSGTPLGDAVEWSALAAAYGGSSQVMVGSVKSAIGHVREVSGLAGFTRMVLSVCHGRIPPTLHVGMPADFADRGDCGLRLARYAQPWRGREPRVGAVSSFGLGGTNVHVIMAQPPGPPSPERRTPRAPGVVLVSANSAAAVDRTAAAWCTAVSAGHASVTEAADVSQFGRRHRRYRRFAVAGDAGHLAAQFTEGDGSTADAGIVEPALCFVFPGVGDHYPRMAAGLRDTLPGFARRLDDYLDHCADLTGRDLRAALGTAAEPGDRPTQAAAVDLRRLLDSGRSAHDAMSDPVISHAGLFCVQLALALSLRDLGVIPAAVTGHSLGEFAAAAFANVFGERDALRIVAARAALVAAQPHGAMLAVSLSRSGAEQLTGPGVWLAAENSPRSCVLAGTAEAIAAVIERLKQQGLRGRLMAARHAFHTPLLDEAGARLAQLLADVPMTAPDIPMIANLTGSWAGTELTDPGYWHRQLTSPVLFGDALRTAAKRCEVLVEIGPGQLRTLAAQAQPGLEDRLVVATIRREYQNDSDSTVLLRALGRLWQSGTKVDWRALRPEIPPAKASLPPTECDERTLYIAEGVQIVASPALLRAELPAHPAPQAATDPSERSTDAGRGAVPGADDAVADLVMTALKHVWEEILGTPDPRPTDDFFDLGGDSMMSALLLAGIERSLGTRVPAVAVFQESTLAGMACRIARWRDGSGEPA